MLRVDRSAGAITLVSRLAKVRVLAVIAGVLLALALAAWPHAPSAGAALAGGAALVVLLGRRPVRARFARGRVSVRWAVPLQPRDDRPLHEFEAARLETVGEARLRKAERLARDYRTKSGGAELPDWLQAPVAPGRNDHLRRVVLVARDDEPLPVTAWLADEDLEPVRVELEALLR